MYSTFCRARIPCVVASNNVDICLRQVYCDSYDYPDNYKLVDNADTTVSKDTKFNNDQCCHKGEAFPEHTLREAGDNTKRHKLSRISISFLPT